MPFFFFFSSSSSWLLDQKILYYHGECFLLVSICFNFSTARMHLIPFWNYPVSSFLRNAWFAVGMVFASSRVISLCVVHSHVCNAAPHSEVSKASGLQSANIQLRWWTFLYLIRSTFLLLILAVMYFNINKPHGPGDIAIWFAWYYYSFWD